MISLQDIALELLMIIIAKVLLYFVQLINNEWVICFALYNPPLMSYDIY